jgi:hypothetical protein
MSSRSKSNKRRPKRMSMGRGVTNVNTIYTFRLVDNNSPPQAQTSTAGGVLASYQNADPSGGSGATWASSEWSNLIAMFSEVRLKSFTVNFVPVPPEDSKIAGTTAGNYLFTSTVLSSISSAPTTSAQVFDNADGKMWTLFSRTASRGLRITLRPRRPLNWAVVTTPNPGSYAGCPGAIQWFADQLPVSTTCMCIKMEGIYEFRSRI